MDQEYNLIEITFLVCADDGATLLEIPEWTEFWPSLPSMDDIFYDQNGKHYKIINKCWIMKGPINETKEGLGQTSAIVTLQQIPGE